MSPGTHWAHRLVFGLLEGDKWMQERVQHTVSVSIGLTLIGAGFLVFVVAYFLFPVLLANGVLTCGDVCLSPKSSSMWTLSLYQLSNFRFAPIGRALALAALFLPLLGSRRRRMYRM